MDIIATPSVLVEIKELYHIEEVPEPLIDFLDQWFEGTIELKDLFEHKFLTTDDKGVVVSPISSGRSIQDSAMVRTHFNLKLYIL